MSNKPIFPPSQAMPLDSLFDQMRGEIDLNTLGKMMGQPVTEDGLSTNKSVAKFLYGMSKQAGGREVLEWLCDLTVRRVDMSPSKSFEEAALAHARAQERAYLMMMITKAIHDGQKLAEAEKGA